VVTVQSRTNLFSEHKCSQKYIYWTF